GSESRHLRGLEYLVLRLVMRAVHRQHWCADSVDLAGRERSIDSGVVVGGNLGSLRRGRIGGWIGDRIGGWIRGRIRHRFRGRTGGREGTAPRTHAQHQGGGHKRQTAHEHDEGEKGVACCQGYNAQVDMNLKLLPGWRTDDHNVIVSWSGKTQIKDNVCSTLFEEGRQRIRAIAERRVAGVIENEEVEGPTLKFGKVSAHLPRPQNAEFDVVVRPGRDEDVR